MNRSILFTPFFAYFLFSVEVNIFTVLALKSKQIELLSSALSHFEDFFKFFPMVTDFDRFFKVVSSQISHNGGTLILAKMVHGHPSCVLVGRGYISGHLIIWATKK